MRGKSRVKNKQIILTPNKNKDSINRKLQVLDLGDPIKLSYVPGEPGNVMWDELDSGSTANDTPIPEIL